MRSTFEIAYWSRAIEHQFVAALPIIEFFKDGQFLPSTASLVEPEGDRKWLVTFKVTNVAETQMSFPIELTPEADRVRAKRHFTAQCPGMVIVARRVRQMAVELVVGHELVA